MKNKDNLKNNKLRQSFKKKASLAIVNKIQNSSQPHAGIHWK